MSNRIQEGIAEVGPETDLRAIAENRFSSTHRFLSKLTIEKRKRTSALQTLREAIFVFREAFGVRKSSSAFATKNFAKFLRACQTCFWR